MITISVLGLDQYVVGHYSKDHTDNLAQLFECEEEEINFYAPSASLFHQGVDQTSWNVLLIVRASAKYEAVESRVVDYLLKTFSEFSIHVQIEFAYFEEEHFYEKINEEYPRFITQDNLVEEGEEETPEDADGCEADPADRADLNPNDPNQLYLGDALKGVEDKIAAKKASSGKKPVKK